MTDSSPERRYRIVTPEQLKAGYCEFYGLIACQRQFTVVGRHANGNYIVIEPEGERRNVLADARKGICVTKERSLVERLRRTVQAAESFNETHRLVPIELLREAADQIEADAARIKKLEEDRNEWRAAYRSLGKEYGRA